VQSVFSSDGTYRYTVLHSGHMWSIPEDALLPISPRAPQAGSANAQNTPQQEQALTDQVSVSCPAVKK
jgi:hypothetical protein